MGGYAALWEDLEEIRARVVADMVAWAPASPPPALTPLPSRFDSVAGYVAAFVPLWLEELREALRAAAPGPRVQPWVTTAAPGAPVPAPAGLVKIALTYRRTRQEAFDAELTRTSSPLAGSTRGAMPDARCMVLISTETAPSVRRSERSDDRASPPPLTGASPTGVTVAGYVSRSTSVVGGAAFDVLVDAAAWAQLMTAERASTTALASAGGDAPLADRAPPTSAAGHPPPPPAAPVDRRRAAAAERKRAATAAAATAAAARRAALLGALAPAAATGGCRGDGGDDDDVDFLGVADTGRPAAGPPPGAAAGPGTAATPDNAPAPAAPSRKRPRGITRGGASRRGGSGSGGHSAEAEAEAEVEGDAHNIDGASVSDEPAADDGDGAVGAPAGDISADVRAGSGGAVAPGLNRRPPHGRPAPLDRPADGPLDAGGRDLFVWSLGSVVSSFREGEALHSLRTVDHGLLTALLAPNGGGAPPAPPAPAAEHLRRGGLMASLPPSLRSTFLPPGDPYRRLFLEAKFNPSQQAAIEAALSRPGWTLVQGPPGTGKTHAIIGLLNTLHVAAYRYYHETLLGNVDALLRRGDEAAAAAATAATAAASSSMRAEGGGGGARPPAPPSTLAGARAPAVEVATSRIGRTAVGDDKFGASLTADAGSGASDVIVIDGDGDDDGPIATSRRAAPARVPRVDGADGWGGAAGGGIVPHVVAATPLPAPSALTTAAVPALTATAAVTAAAAAASRRAAEVAGAGSAAAVARPGVSGGTASAARGGGVSTSLVALLQAGAATHGGAAALPPQQHSQRPTAPPPPRSVQGVLRWLMNTENDVADSLDRAQPALALRPRILVTAPSNAAIDGIVLRIAREGMRSGAASRPPAATAAAPAPPPRDAAPSAPADAAAAAASVAGDAGAPVAPAPAHGVAAVHAAPAPSPVAAAAAADVPPPPPPQPQPPLKLEMFRPSIVRVGDAASAEVRAAGVALEDMVDAVTRMDARALDAASASLAAERAAIVGAIAALRLTYHADVRSMRARVQADVSARVVGVADAARAAAAAQDALFARAAPRLLAAVSAFERNRAAATRVSWVAGALSAGDGGAVRREVRNSLLEAAEIVLTTTSSAAVSTVESFVQETGTAFDVVLIDEAAQAAEPSSLIPLRYGCSQAVLVGDPQQLPATILSRAAAAAGYDRSLFARLVDAGHGVHLLDTQYRMHPAIAAFPSARFYGGRVRDAPSVCGRGRFHPMHECRARRPLVVFNLCGGRQEAPTRAPSPAAGDGRAGAGTACGGGGGGGANRTTAAPGGRRPPRGAPPPSSSSPCNPVEAAFVVHALRALHAWRAVDVHTGARIKFTGTVGVITFYRGQLELLRRLVAERFVQPGEADAPGTSTIAVAAAGMAPVGGSGGLVATPPPRERLAFRVDVNTVDAFQGQERDVVLLSCVRTVEGVSGGDGAGASRIGFLADPRRMNVALTRAKYGCWVVGHAPALRSSPHWAALVDHAAAAGVLVTLPAATPADAEAVDLEALPAESSS